MKLVKTHCHRGHRFSEKNTYVDIKTGSRTCRTCRSMRSIAWRNRNYNKVIAKERFRNALNLGKGLKNVQVEM